MSVLRWMGAGLLWILAGVFGLLGGLLCLTIILMPLGIPLLMLAKKVGTRAGRLMLPKALRHPVKEAGSQSRGLLGRSRKSVVDVSPPKPPKLSELRKRTSRKLRRRKGIRRLKWWG